jgi:hypothetical protein
MIQGKRSQMAILIKRAQEFVAVVPACRSHVMGYFRAVVNSQSIENGLELENDRFTGSQLRICGWGRGSPGRRTGWGGVGGGPHRQLHHDGSGTRLHSS